LKQKSDNRFDTISTFNRKITRFYQEILSTKIDVWYFDDGAYFVATFFGVVYA
jgi:hypothetical protein